MFTGIIGGTATIIKLLEKPGLLTIVAALPPPQDEINIGASISINGVCLTVTCVDGFSVSFDAIQETLVKTNLSKLSEGSIVNYERAAKFGSEIGGHQVSGHIDGTAKIDDIQKNGGDVRVFLKTSPFLIQYIFPKGYIALNGASLTVVDVDRENLIFSVALIPETLKITTFGDCAKGDLINVEIDRITQAVVETVKLVLADSK